MKRLPFPWTALAGLTVALVIAGGSKTVWASDPGRAEDLIRRANDLRRQGQDPAAFPLLQEAYRIARSPRTAAQLGLVELSLSYWLEAERHLGEALGTTSNAWVDRNRKVLESSLASARTHVGTIVIDGAPDQAEVRVNDASVGNLPLAAPIRVAEGQVTIELRASGYQSQSRTLVVTGRATEHASFHLARIPSAPEPLKPSEGSSTTSSTATSASTQSSSRDSFRWQPLLPWMFAGAAAVAGGLAVWQHIGWQHDVSKFDNIGRCATGEPMRGTDQRCQGLYDQYSSERTRALVAYGFAGAFAVTSAVLFVSSASSGSERPTQGFVPGPGTVGLGWRGTY